MKSKKSSKVVIAIPTNGADGREMVSGAFDWIGEHPRWEVQIINARTDMASGALEKLSRDADGVLLSIAYDSERIARHFLSSNMKMVVTNDHLAPLYAKSPNSCTLLLDSVSIGRDAARYFNSLGRFASYGFVHGHKRFPWSIERENGFRNFKAKATELFIYPETCDMETEGFTSAIDLESLAQWVQALPKPAAVFGANDLFARDVLTACDRLGLKIPQQVSVVGCDNDPLICTSTKVQLTSFQLPFRELGYKACGMLERLLCGRKPPSETIRISGTRLVERGSSAPVPPSIALVERALNYINLHACEGIGAADVVQHLGVSRSLLDLRFAQVRNKSILGEILDVRLAETKRLLASTNRTILQIGRECGFNDPDNLKRLFRKRFGMAMRDYRNMKRDSQG